MRLNNKAGARGILAGHTAVITCINRLSGL